MLYAIMTRDIDSSIDVRSRTREEHLRYVGELRNAGRLVLAGPHPRIDSPDPGPAGMEGSLIVAEFESASAARDWAENDPYSLAGVFEEVIVKPFVQVYP